MEMEVFYYVWQNLQCYNDDLMIVDEYKFAID